MTATGTLGVNAAPRRSRRLVVLFFVLAGFLSMHGFTAASAAAPAAASVTHEAVVQSGHASVSQVGGRALEAATRQLVDVEAAGSGPSFGGPEHQPSDHSDVLAGCFLALVGVVGIALAVAGLRRRGLLAAGGLLGRRLPVLAAPVLAAPHPAPTPYRLCVMRV